MPRLHLLLVVGLKIFLVVDGIILLGAEQDLMLLLAHVLELVLQHVHLAA